MTSIIEWIKRIQHPTAKEIEDDWCMIDEFERDDDIASSICTIEPILPNPKAKPQPNEVDLRKAVENRIMELSSAKQYQLRNDLAQLKDKELKMRKLQKLKRRS